MNDQDLVKLVQEKTPEELTVEEIESLREGLGQSPELQQVLCDQLQLEQYLAAALGRVDVSVDDILRRVRRDIPPERRLLVSLGWALGLLAGLLLTAALARTLWNKQDSPEQPVAQAESANGRNPDIEQENSPSGERDDTTATVGDSSDAGQTDQDRDSRRRPEPGNSPAPDEAPQPGTDTPGAPQDVNPQQAGRQADAEKPQEKPQQQAASPAGSKKEQQQPPAPWESDSQLAGPVWAVEDLAWAPRAQPGATDTWRRWFSTVSGQRSSIQTKDGMAQIEGVLRLKSPWPARAMLRLVVPREEQLQIYLWQGTQGVLLKCRDNRPDLTWAGYQVHREDAGYEPAHYALTSSDQGRAWRTGGHDSHQDLPLDVRFENGLVILARGDIRLLSVPLSAAPEEVYLAGKFRLRNLQMLRAAPLPPEGDPPRPTVLDTAAEQVHWHRQVPAGGSLTPLAEQGVRLSGDAEAEAELWAAVEVPPCGVWEAIVELDGVTPGTGVYLGDEKGRPLAGPRFMEEKQTGQLVATMVPASDKRHEMQYDFAKLPLPLVGEHLWVRLMVAGGRLKCWVSSDGQHFGQVWMPDTVIDRPAQTVGVYAAGIKRERQINLRRVIVRSYPQLASLAPAELVARAPVIFTRQLGPWMERSTALQPPDVPADEWLMACALRSLGAGLPAPASGDVALWVARQGLSADRPLADRLALLDEVLAASTTWSAGYQGLSWPRVAPLNEQLANIAAERERRGEMPAGEQRVLPFRTIARRALTAPWWTTDHYHMIHEPLARREIIELLTEQDWPALYRLSTELEMLASPSLSDLTQWSTAIAGREVEGAGESEPLAIDDRQRHPLVVELTREGFNVLSELDVAVQNRSLEDACQIITSISGDGAFGLLPSAKDPRLWSAFPLSVAETMRRHPQLLTTMRNKYGPVGELRVRDAIARRDPAAVELATVQFHGTVAASRAHLWLGDRALSAGDFAAAMGHYRTALLHADPTLKRQVAAHRRLAAAMLGQEWGAAAESPIQLGDAQFTAGEFERLISDTLAHRRDSVAAGAQPSAETYAAFPAPARLEAQKRYPLGATGNDFGLIRSEHFIYINDGANLRCFDLQQGAWVWQQRLGDEKRMPDVRSRYSLKPLLLGERLLAHIPSEGGGILVCVERQTGKPVWKNDLAQDGHVVSDPVLIDGVVHAVTKESFGRQITLRLTAFDPATGQSLRRRMLAHFGRSWEEQPACTIARQGGGLIIATGGSVLRIDTDGEVRWVRKQTWLPFSRYRPPVMHVAQPPLLWRDRVLVSQTSSPTVECLDAASGRMLWRTVEQRLLQLVGLAGDRLVLLRADGLAALDMQSGRQLWHLPLAAPMTAVAAGERATVLGTFQTDKESHALRLYRVDLGRGAITAIEPVGALQDKAPVANLLFPHDQQWLVIYGRESHKPGRELLQLVPAGDPLVVQDRISPPGPAAAELRQPQREALRIALPRWQAYGVDHENAAQLAREHQEAQGVLVTSPSGSEPIRLTRLVAIPPAAAQARLKMEVAADPQGKAELDVQVAGTILYRSKLDGQSGGAQWQNVEVDLLPYAGQSVWLTIRHHQQGDHSRLYWKSCQLELESPK